MRVREVVSAVVVATALSLVSYDARAQEEVGVAAKAFAEGQQAQLRGDFMRAAELFEIADQAVPSAQALRSAIRTRGAAGQEVRSATLALQALQRYPEDAETRSVAEATITRFGPRLTRIRLVCSEPCTATLDGALIGVGALTKFEFFATPGTHVVRASWPGRPAVSALLEPKTGQSLDVALTAPAQPRAASVPAAPAPTAAPLGRAPALSSSVPPVAVPEPESRGLTPAVFWIGVGLTAACGALVYWSGADTLDERDDYERNPTRKGYDRGVKLERRTNLLIGGTAVLGAATLGIGLFATDWGGSSRVGLRVGRDQVALSMVGALP